MLTLYQLMPVLLLFESRGAITIYNINHILLYWIICILDRWPYITNQFNWIEWIVWML